MGISFTVAAVVLSIVFLSIGILAFGYVFRLEFPRVSDLLRSVGVNFSLERWFLPKEERERLDREDQVEEEYQKLQMELILCRQKVAQAITAEKNLEKQLNDSPSDTLIQSKLDKQKRETSRLRSKLNEFERKTQRSYTEKQQFIARSKAKAALAKVDQEIDRFGHCLAQMDQAESEFLSRSQPDLRYEGFDALLEKYQRLVESPEKQADDSSSSFEDKRVLAAEIEELKELSAAFLALMNEFDKAIEQHIECETELQKTIDLLTDKTNYADSQVIAELSESRKTVCVSTEELREAYFRVQLMRTKTVSRLAKFESVE